MSNPKNKVFVLNMVMFLKSITLLPKSVLALNATLLSVDENILQHYITRRDFVGLKKDVASTPTKGFESKPKPAKKHKKKQDDDEEDTKDTGANSLQDDTNIGNETYINDDKLNWENSLKKCFDEALGLHKLYLTVMAKQDNNVSKSGTHIRYDVRFGQSDLYSFSGDILQKCIKETSLATGNGGFFLDRFTLSMACILSSQDTTTLSALDPFGSSMESEENFKHASDSNSMEDDDCDSSDYPNIFDKDIYFTYQEKENLTNNSVDVTFIEDANIVDSCIDRSYMFLGFCVNLLYTLRAIVQRIKHVSPSDVDPEFLYKITDLFAQKSGRKENPNDHIVLGDNVRKEVTEIKLNPGGKSCDIVTNLRKVRNSVGIWGSDCLFMDYIGSLRRLKQSKNSGFDAVMDITNEDHVKHFSLFNNNNNDDNNLNDSSSSSSSTATTNGAQEMLEEQNPEKALLNELWGHINIMCAERNGYCTATLTVVQNVHREFSKYVHKCHAKYIDFINSHKYSTNSFKKKFHQKVSSSNLSNNMTMGNSSSTSKNANVNKEEEESTDSFSLRYRGSSEYEKKRKENELLRNVMLSVMTETEYIPYFGEHLDPKSEQQSVIEGDGGSIWRRCFTIKNLPMLSDTFGFFVQNQVDINKAEQNENTMQVDSIESETNESLDLIDNSEESIKIFRQLQELQLGSLYSYVQHAEITLKMSLSMPHQPGSTTTYFRPFNVFCIFGIPEVILMDEECLLKWISLVSKSKTDPPSLAFKNPKNKNLPTLCSLISTAWRAKSAVTMKEYNQLTDIYDEKYIKNVVLASLKKHTQ